MLLSETVVIALITATTGIAITLGRKKRKDYSGWFVVGAILSWVLLFFYIFYEPSTTVISGRNPITAEAIEAIVVVLIIAVECIGFYLMETD